METFEINGTQYEEIPRSPKRFSKSMSRVMIAATMIYAPIMENLLGGHTKTKQRPDVNIIEEYALIQQKKSKLSRNDREWVKMVFEENFRPVKIIA